MANENPKKILPAAPIAASPAPEKAPVVPAAGTLPPTSITAAPAKGKSVTIAAVVGATYGVAVAVPNGAGAPGTSATVVLPYRVPAWMGKEGSAVSVKVASVAPNWLGMNSLPLMCTVYHSTEGSVVVQREPAGCKVNAYPNGLSGSGLWVEEMR